ncbi:MAG: helix-turn-helix transcriptional regulator, partial [Methylacidiphilales bacterium]|nr:helix-turn-helix transcriptional regulator [Candidatus Methylacidiphilales bacterium]
RSAHRPRSLHRRRRFAGGNAAVGAAGAVRGSAERAVDLTPAEARVARALIEGQSVTDFARTVGLSPETTRTQLKSVFAKTGTRRQIELVALLAGKGLLPVAKEI